MHPQVSIIVGVYNGEKYLAQLLDSVLAQTAQGWFCICVNDGSTDSSEQILDAYAKRDGRFRVVSRNNGGVGAARNTALELVETPFVMFADQDDKLLPMAVEKALAAIESSGADVVRFQSNRHDRVSPFVWERIFRMDAIKGVRFAPITGGEDTAFMWELGLMNLKMQEIPDELYWNRPSGGSFSRAVSPKYIENVFLGFRAMRDSAHRHGMSRFIACAKLVPHVFWFSVSIVFMHASRRNIKTLLAGVRLLIWRQPK